MAEPICGARFTTHGINATCDRAPHDDPDHHGNDFWWTDEPVLKARLMTALDALEADRKYIK